MSHLGYQKTHDHDQDRREYEEMHVGHPDTEDHGFGSCQPQRPPCYLKGVEKSRHYEVDTYGGYGQEVRLKSQRYDAEDRSADTGNDDSRQERQKEVSSMCGDDGCGICTDSEEGCDTHHRLTGIAGDYVQRKSQKRKYGCSREY